jgi:3,4-dihydroxy-2-butanone 4-phosphate synthase
VNGRLPADLAGPFEAAVSALADGRVVVVTDVIRDIGVVGVAGSRTTPENVNFLIRHCRGIVYAAVSRAQLDRLRIGHQYGADVMREHVYVAVDAIDNVTTGVSAADRMRTIRTIIDPTSTRAALRTPGHVLPTVVDMSGRIETFYVNEALQYLADAAGLGDGLALAAVLAPDGEMATADQLVEFAREHDAPLLDVTDVLRARRAADGWPEPSPGQLTASLRHLRTDIAVTSRGAHQRHDRFPVVVLPFCPAGHALRTPGPCRERLDAALDRLDRDGAGAVVLTWPAGRPLPPDGDAEPDAERHGGRRHHHTANPRLARLIAADLAAALPTEPVHRA